MKGSRSLLVFFFIFPGFIFAQLPLKEQTLADSLQQELSKDLPLMTRAVAMTQLVKVYTNYYPDSAVAIAQEIIQMGKTNQREDIGAIGQVFLGHMYSNSMGGTREEGISILQQAIPVLEREGMEEYLAKAKCVLGFSYAYLSRLDSCFTLQLEGLELAKQSGSSHEEMFCCNALGISNMIHNQPALADSFILLTHDLAKREKDYKRQFDTYMIRGRIKIGMAQPTQALDFYYTGVQFAKDHGAKDWEGIAMESASACYAELADFEKAKTSALKAVELLSGDHPHDRYYHALNTLGGAYVDLDKPDSAIHYLMEAKERSHSIPDPILKGSLMFNLCLAYRDLGDLQLAEKYADSALAIVTPYNILPFMEGAYHVIADNQLHLGNHRKAIEYGRKSLEISEITNNTSNRINSTRVLYQAYKNTGRMSQSLEMLELHLAAREELLSESNIRELSRLEEEFNYRLVKATDSIKAAEALNNMEALAAAESERADQQTGRLIVSVIGVVILLLLGGIALFLFILTRRRKAKIEAQKEEVELLLKEIHHRVKNNLQVVSSLLELQALQIDESAALTAVTDGQNRVKAMALIHEKLYQNENLALIDFRDFAAQLLVQVGALFPNGKQVKTSVEAERISLDIDTAVPVGLILNELITNAFKYAISDPSMGKINVTLHREEDGAFRLIVQDNGPGMPEGFDLKASRSLGLRLVKNLARQLYGKVEYSNAEGALFLVNFKGTEARKAVE